MRSSKKCFTFVKSNKNGLFGPIFVLMETKDRIRMLMEDQHMTQQVFADFIQQSPATLSSIFNGRTRPTLNIVEAIKAKIPDISVEWLLFGTGDMHISHPQEAASTHAEGGMASQEQMLNFENSPSPENFSTVPARPMPTSVSAHQQSVRNTHLDLFHEGIKNIDKEPRHVTEIRVYYDDQTYETFVPAKSK